MFSDQLLDWAKSVLDRFAGAGLKLATAESCTGGLIAGTLTEVPGSSSVVDRGFVTYSNEAKTELLDVPAALIAKNGAVSEPVVRAMASGALVHSNADVAVAVTGIAGPGGATPDKPVGLVHLAVMRRGRDAVHIEAHFDGDRQAVRMATVIKALDMLDAQADAAAPAGA